MTTAPNPHDAEPSAYTERQHWMAVLARAEAAEIAALLYACAPVPVWQTLRGPESGLVMVRGRAGGGGQAFNMGEMTVTRCTPMSPGATVTRQSWRHLPMRCCSSHSALHCCRSA